MNFIKKNWRKLFLIALFILLPVFFIYADPEPCDSTKVICNPLETTGTNTLPELIQKVLLGALKIGIPLIALAVIYCGFLFVKARGNPEELTKAKDALLYTLIGAAILLGSWAIATLISNTVTTL